MKILFSFLLISLTCLCHADIKDCKTKQEANSKIIKILDLINNLDAEKLYKKTADFSEAKKLIAEIDDPELFAKLVIFTHYLSYPGGIDTTALDDTFYALCNISDMKKFKEHKQYAQGLLLIQKGIPLDAHNGEQFAELILDSKDNSEIQKYFSSTIKRFDSVKK